MRRRGPITGGKARVDGKFLRVGDERFWIKGVTYGTFKLNAEGEPYPPIAKVRDDFAQMAAAGINTARLYTPPSDRIADAAAQAGIYLVPDVCWGSRTCELDTQAGRDAIYSWARQHARRLGEHPAVLMQCIGNETPPLIARWYGPKMIEDHLHRLYDIVKQEAPDSLVTYANYPPTEYLNLSFLDMLAFNVYLERDEDFRAYLARLQNLAGQRPLLLGEIGADSGTHGEEGQARLVEQQLEAVFAKGLCGAMVYSWTDEWAVQGVGVHGWSFGLTGADRAPKPALRAVQRVYGSSLYDLRHTPWPRVTVVVCAYNAQSTLDTCLRSLGRLHYPNYDVVVIDDGSKDATPDIAARHRVRYFRVPNGGLSRARNLGIEHASGDIVAFTDADAYVDPDWLFYLVTALEDRGAAAVGGPNLSPPEDGFVAQCVDHAPGNPVHVLFDNETAEHVPGCNMGFRREALRAIGGFDPVHSAAGDDVDVCWKLLVRGKKIAFAPSAVVWHHRRPTVHGYLRQQKGYGFAESQLQLRYPGRFNIFGDLVWRGNLYDSVHASLRCEGVPSIFRPRVYRGWFGSAPYQSIYQRFHTWWFQIFTAAEWQGTTLCALVAALLAWCHHSPHAMLLLLILALLMAALSLSAAGLAATHAARAEKWTGVQKWKGFILVAGLHLLQPLYRSVGRVRGWWYTRRNATNFLAVQRVWGGDHQRELWLQRLPSHLETCGWVCKASSAWDNADLDIEGPGPCRLQLMSVTEVDHANNAHFVRYRVTARMKRRTPLMILAMVLTLPIWIIFPYLIPFTLPVVVCFRLILHAEQYMVSAVSQLALECAEALDMPRVVEPGD